jgi:hypothetical protein
MMMTMELLQWGRMCGKEIRVTAFTGWQPSTKILFIEMLSLTVSCIHKVFSDEAAEGSLQ